MSKKVLVFSHEFPPYGGGAGVVAKQYCMALYEMGIDVTLVTRKQKNYSLPNKINIIGIPHIKKIWFIPYVFFLKKMNLHQQNTILLNDIASAYVAGFLFKKKYLKKSCVFLHGSEPEKIYKYPSFLFRLTRYKFFYNKVLLGAKKIISVSHYMKEKFLQETNFKNRGKIEVLYAGLDNYFFREGIRNSIRAKNDVKENILTVSRVERGKGFDEMYQLYKQIIAVDDGYNWTIVGEGSYLSVFKEMIVREGYNKSIFFKGRVPREELKSYYERADVFLLLSNYKESFGLVYLEAQAFGCPVIGYNKYGVKESVCQGTTGFLVDDKSECLSILLNKKYRNLKSFESFVGKFSPQELKKSIDEKVLC